MDPKITADFDALSHDATTWDGVGDTLTGAHNDIAGIPMSKEAFSFAAGDVADRYFAFHDRVAQLLTDGSASAHGGAAALRAVRADFEKFEDITRADYYGMWKPAN
jgi:hypothetical protein